MTLDELMTHGLQDLKEIMGGKQRSPQGLLAYQLRMKRKLSIRAVARAIGLHPMYISRIENGERHMTEHQIAFYASFFGVDANEFRPTPSTLSS